MSLNHVNLLSDVLVDDILLQIFSYLDVYDLANCEAVCHRWHQLFQSYVWKSLLRTKVNHFPLWQKYQKRIEMDERLCNLKSGERYKLIFREIKLLYDNWWTGNFILHLLPIDRSQYGICFKMDKNWLVFFNEFSLYIFYRHAMKLMHTIPALGSNFTSLQVKNSVIICGTDSGMIKIYNLITGEQINEFAEPNGWPVHDINFEIRGLTVAISKNTMSKHCRLTFWRVEESCCKVTYLNQLPIPKEKEEHMMYFLWMDDNFVVLFQHGIDSTRIVIVSTETRTIAENFTVPSGKDMRYEYGRIILRYPSFIRIGFLSHRSQRPIDFFVDLVPERDENENMAYRTNSKYLAVFKDLDGKGTRVTLYDLQAIKERKNRPNSVFHFEVPYYVYNLEMDETQLVCMGCHIKREDVDVVLVFDFAQNPPFRVRDEEKPRRSGKVSTRYTEMAVLDSFIPNQVESSKLRNVPFTVRIAKERANVASSYYRNLFKWPFAISTCVLLFFVVKLVKIQNK